MNECVKACLCAAIELGQGEFGSVLKGTWKAPSGEVVSCLLMLSGLVCFSAKRACTGYWLRMRALHCSQFYGVVMVVKCARLS